MKNSVKYFFVLLLCIVSINIFAQTQGDTNEEGLENDVILSVSNTVQNAMSNPEYLVTPGDVYSLNYAAGTTPVLLKTNKNKGKKKNEKRNQRLCKKAGKAARKNNQL